MTILKLERKPKTPPCDDVKCWNEGGSETDCADCEYRKCGKTKEKKAA